VDFIFLYMQKQIFMYIYEKYFQNIKIDVVFLSNKFLFCTAPIVEFKCLYLLKTIFMYVLSKKNLCVCMCVCVYIYIYNTVY